MQHLSPPTSEIVIIPRSVTELPDLYGCRRYELGMPLAWSCSVATRAACHLPEEDVNASEKSVLCGLVGMEEDGLGDCTPTILRAEAPIEGERYTGLRRDLAVANERDAVGPEEEDK